MIFQDDDYETHTHNATPPSFEDNLWENAEHRLVSFSNNSNILMEPNSKRLWRVHKKKRSKVWNPWVLLTSL